MYIQCSTKEEEEQTEGEKDPTIRKKEKMHFSDVYTVYTYKWTYLFIDES